MQVGTVFIAIIITLSTLACFKGEKKMSSAIKSASHVKLYSASYCPYCVKAKKLLESKNVTFEEIDVTDPSTRDDMIKLSGGRKTVPQIFIGGNHIGGCDDLYALEKAGKLDPLLK